MNKDEMKAFIDALGRKSGKCAKETLSEEERQMAGLWEQLGELDPGTSRDEELVSDFQRKLAAYKLGFAEAESRSEDQDFQSTYRQPARWEGSPLLAFFRYSMVAGVAAVLALCGYIATSQAERSRELERRLANTQETLALALLEQSSAPKRLAGLAAASEVRRPSEQLRATMLRTFDSDTNLNVRLAAVSAIATLPREEALAVLLERMENEQSALVQAEILRQVMNLVENGSNAKVLERLEQMHLEPKLKTALESRDDKI